MKLKCLSCEALARPVYLNAATSPHTVDVEVLRLGLHNRPDGLREILQEKIDASTGFEAIVLAYGLCGKATAGLVARDAPLVIPRAHDCITLFLGSRQRYQEQFRSQPGTYWYTLDYIERGKSSGEVTALGAEMAVDLTAVYDEYVEKYGQDNADYLMEVMSGWQQHYQRAVFIDLGLGDSKGLEADTEAEAARRGWAYEKLTGDLTLMRRLLFGEWDEDFLVVEPGQQITMSGGDGVVVATGMANLDPAKIE